MDPGGLFDDEQMFLGELEKKERVWSDCRTEFSDKVRLVGSHSLVVSRRERENPRGRF